MTKAGASREADDTPQTPRGQRGRAKRGDATPSQGRTPKQAPKQTPKQTLKQTPAKQQAPKKTPKAAATPKGKKDAQPKTKDAPLTEPTPPAKRRKTSKKSHGANKGKDLDARVFFNNRLNAHEADTSQFEPAEEDRLLFEAARAAAEQEEAKITGISQLSLDPGTPSTPGSSAPVGYQVKKIRIGGFEIDSWYISPYPDEYSRHPLLYICEFCLKYMKSEYTYRRHCTKCMLQHPPGDEIYRDGNLSVFEVDGRKNKIYCQNLCLIGKMFLDTKTLYYDVEPFLFYILCEYDSTGYHVAGYYSKEKRSVQGYNLSCIMILPPKQREGYGKLLIEFSYLLSKKEGMPGSPEKPLSDFGLLSYRSYWRRAIYEILLNVSQKTNCAVSIDAISKKTGMTVDDIISTLQTDGMLQRQPGVSNYALVVDAKRIEGYVEKAREKNPRRIDPSKLRWAPFLTKGAAVLEQPKGDDELSAGELSV
ncbi:Histone acetyltransferase [Coemansia sp. RSA 2711]|nr:Histone acetyltransferase [Coemansia sp. RSA 2711]